MKARFLFLVPALALGACAGGSYCEGKQDYQRARSIPAVQPAEGLRLPESDATLRIPPPAKNAVPFAETGTDEDGDEVVTCLDKPPQLPPLAEPKDAPTAPTPEKKPS